MDQASLVNDRSVRAGTQLIKLLEQAGMKIESALWINDPEWGSPRLLLATEGASFDLRQEYLRLSTVMNNNPQIEATVSSSDVMIVEHANKTLRLLSKGLGKPVKNKTVWRRSTVGGTIIEDALIYRLAA